VLGLSLLLSACFSEHVTVPQDGPVSFAQDVEPLLNANCTGGGCHTAQNAQPTQKRMPLVTGQSYASIVNVSSLQLPSMDRIEPGQPDRSYLIHKLQGTHQQQGGQGQQMPLGSALSQAQIDMLRRWVTQGAQQN
jgi:hypothetical protein